MIHHFDTTLVFEKALINKEREKNIAPNFYKSDFYKSKDEKPIYAYISYFKYGNRFNYTERIEIQKCQEEQVKENREKYDAD